DDAQLDANRRLVAVVVHGDLGQPRRAAGTQVGSDVLGSRHFEFQRSARRLRQLAMEVEHRNPAARFGQLLSAPLTHRSLGLTGCVASNVNGQYAQDTMAIAQALQCRSDATPDLSFE